MKNKLPKNIIVPAIFGLILYIFLFLGQNAKVFSNNSSISWIAMLLGVIVLYGIILGAINNLMNLNLGYAGFKLSSVFFGLFIPISIFAYNQFWKEPKTSYSSLLDKKGVTLISDNKKCSKIKYGSFTNGIDTIVRYSENNKDFVIYKSNNSEIRCRIKWLDSCSYIKLKDNNSVSHYISLGNFKNNQHYMYTKPGIPHNIEDQSYELILELRE